MIAILSGICYAVTIRKLRSGAIQGNAVKSVTTQATVTIQVSRSSRRRKAELNITVAGIILFIMTGFYALYCGATAFATDPEALKQMLKFQNLMGDAYSWINPYLLLLFSSAVRKHFIATALRRHPNEVTSINNPTTNARAVATRYQQQHQHN